MSSEKLCYEDDCVIPYKLVLSKEIGDSKNLHEEMMVYGQFTVNNNTDNDSFLSEIVVVRLPKTIRDSNEPVHLELTILDLPKNIKDYTSVNVTSLLHEKKQMKVHSKLKSTTELLMTIIRKHEVGKHTKYMDHNNLECNCKKEKCSCCSHINIPVVGLDHDICFNVTYNKKNKTVFLTMEMEKEIVLQKIENVMSPTKHYEFIPTLEKHVYGDIQMFNIHMGRRMMYFCTELLMRRLQPIMEELSETSQKKDKSENNNKKRTEEKIIDVKDNSKNIKALENNYYNNVVNNTNKDFQFNFTDNNNISLPPDSINSKKNKQTIFNRIRNKITINTLDSFDSISMTDVSQISTPSTSSYGTLFGDQSNISDDDTISQSKMKSNLLEQKVDDILKEFDEDDMDNKIEKEEKNSRYYNDIDDSCDDTLSISTTDSEEDKVIKHNNNQLNLCETNLSVHRMSFIMQEKLHVLAQNIKRRTTYVREEMIKDISSDEEDAKSVTLPMPEQQTTLMDLLGLEESVKEPTSWSDIIFKSSINSHSKTYLFWLAFVVLAFIYNALVCPLRSSYPYQTPENLKYWMMIDYTADIIYILDIIFIKPRLSFMENGMLITSKAETKKHYLKSKKFIFDVISILPTDLMYFRTGPVSLWRYNRIVKIQSYWDFFSILDNSFSNPYAIRILKTFSYMIYIIHCNSCVYYTLSAWQAFGQLAYRMRGKWYLNKWVYNNQGNSYFRCFYFTAAVATSTGNNPAPTNVIEYIYMTFSWMMGVFVFALLLGQIRDIVSNANKNKEMFRTTMDQALSECKKLNLPKELTNRVRDWFLYTWDQQKTLEERNLVNKLPLKLQADLALSVHYNTLSKVQLFQDCERALLRELVLKLQPVIFLPGDMICKKGDVGKEMYIVNQGILQVVGGDNNEIVFAEMCEGTVFGEISLMAIGGNNRRTASIRSKGYSTLFVLSKEDLNDVIKDYPEAQRLLKKKAKQMLKKDQKSKEPETKDSKKDIAEKCKVTTEIKTPKMLSTIANVLRPGSAISKTISEIIENDKEERKFRRWGTLQSDSDMSEIEFPQINVEEE
ncbi:Cyclic nucleotide-binding domain and Ion transport domain and RmlC-like jelly roll fold domain and Cyclic nucleotide-binding-like domain-containing protein [Strongyloides ratti]|uniref:Cyclic nucleotide-binding domain and Ion transport domain and RmlC-like jelly roll fold domain and Cyclic nucleotide-binding-like domain-containing protein n=1 Tax=Strongyloides ratti TaxID=34506 RepID=A0A090L4L3_STRRB|nr:Cyclic nucleotide-binding domain and Ion transport domain and RmlC-like jelly roll fold domain and Cyclic nucleotide-binding-like domain-containing protein [Strongyloides ratti]CEF64657.1 Cyclic nucleotide-binding domain and Ion transport domain and RmlC-like jelly roll fold domain and Cyclic nucleotide-binding-like domain-containing protein [Strongyloides ratti]